MSAVSETTPYGGDRTPGSADPSTDSVDPSGRVAIEVRDVSKTFSLPGHRIDTIKERVLQPFARPDVHALHALRDISFEVMQGEFFGVVGRNGSGKSTLLKILASIYRADTGQVRMAGSLAPFIELGVGFNTDLTAEENIVLNGVMMGLTREQARTRIDAVLEFAELREFVEMKLKNYSSGMLVRLAFSIMLQAETDILLIDEVLAVGDAAFQQKCADVFKSMRDSARTVILVTHDMRTVDQYCHRAMLLNEGRIEAIGEPHEIGRRYLTLNFEGAADELRIQRTHTREETAAASEVRLTDAWLEDEHGARILNVEQGAEIRFNAILEAHREIVAPTVGFSFSDSNGVVVFVMGGPSGSSEPLLGGMRPGERARVTGTVPNRLAAGRYDVGCWVGRNNSPNDVAMHLPHALDFVVYGREDVAGLVALDHRVEAEVISSPREEG